MSAGKRKLSPKERRLLSALSKGGYFYVYVDEDGGVDGCARYPDWPAPGTGAVVHDGAPEHCTARFVRLLWRLGTAWDHALQAAVLSPEGRVKADALLHSRDVLLIATPEPSPLTPEHQP